MKYEVSFSVDAKHTLTEAKFAHESPPGGQLAVLPRGRLADSAQCSVVSRKTFVRHKRQSRCDESLVARRPIGKREGQAEGPMDKWE